MIDNNNKNNLLMIAYHFPPQGGSAALRPLKIAKYLPSFGWKPNILTVRNPDWYYAHDPELLAELNPKIKIIKAPMFKSLWLYRMINPMRIEKFDNFIKRFLIHPDDQIGWLLFAYFYAINTINKDNIKAIYSSSGPITCHLIAYLIKKQTNIPWIADFRDEWFEAPNNDMPTNIHIKFHLKIENMVVKNADKIVCMAPVFVEFLKKHTNDLKKFYTIPAGFDPDDIISIKKLNSNNKISKKFTLTFTGLFYNTFRPKALLQAVSELIAKGKIDRDKIKIKFVGGNSFSDLDYKDKFEICEFTGFLPRIKALKHAAESNALLLLLSSERGKDVIPSKIFEYLALKKPILGIVPINGEVANIIRKTRSGIVADFDNVNEIKRAILELYNKWQKNELHQKQDIKEINKYNQINLVGKLAEILKDITD